MQSPLTITDARLAAAKRPSLAAREHVFVAWLLLLATPAVVLLVVPNDWPRWIVMWLMAIGTYGCCKWLAWFSSKACVRPWQRAVGWWLAWPGMDASRFLATTPLPRHQRPVAIEWFAAGSKIILGVVMFAAARGLLAAGWITTGAWLGMTGFIVILHCGVFHLLSCVWRSSGIDARPLMDRPLAASSLADFWSRRWNRAFRDLSFAAVYRPMVRRFGGTIATLAVFAFSGIVHELVITLPAGAGYGLPTVYFLLQGLGIVFQHSTTGKAAGLGSGWIGRLFALALVALPLPLLFPPPFVYGIVIPFLSWPR